MAGNLSLATYEVPQMPLLTRQEASELSQRIAAGDKEAKERFIEANMLLVLDVAARYRCDFLDTEDLVQEGVFGLIKAVEKFDPTRGPAFSTMAHWWIQQAVMRAIDNYDRTIRLPSHLMEEVRLIHRETTKLHMKLQRTPTEEEIVAHTGKSLTSVKAVTSASWVSHSLDMQVDFGNPGAEVYGDFIEDPDINIEEDYLAQMHDERALLHRAMETALTERERDIFSLHYGINCQEHKIWQIAKRYGITKQRVQQILEKSLRKVRQSVHEMLAKSQAA